MMTHAYDPIYLNKSARAVGNMLHDAVYEFGYDPESFLKLFIQSGIAEQIENGNPKYIAGKSGLELYCDVIEAVTGGSVNAEPIESYDRSDVYWVGWALAHYQCHSRKSFRDILDVIPYDELSVLYNTLHEADIRKAYEVFDERFKKAKSKLQLMRKRAGITQEELAELSGVSASTIRAYERKAKDIGKAQVDIVIRLSQALNCEVTDIID